jgi:hypothetical protein
MLTPIVRFASCAGRHSHPRSAVSLPIQGADDPEDPPLPAVMAGQLRDLVDTLNISAAHKPKLVELDELRGPRQSHSVAENGNWIV